MKTFASITGAIILGVASLNTATAEPQVASKVVKYSDLDLDSLDGAATLYRRISNAVKSVCSSYDGGKMLVQRQAFTRCVRSSVNRAVAKIDSPALRHYASSRGYVMTPDPTVASTND